MNIKNKIYNELKKLLPATVALTALALVINILAWKYKLISGGFPGYGLLLNYLTGYSVGSVLLVLNTIIFLLTFLIAGKNTGARAIYGYIFFSIIIDFSRNALGIQQTPIDNNLQSAFLLALQGFLAGSAVSIFINSGYSAGGWGSFIFVVKKYINIAPQRFFLIMDLILGIVVSFQYGIIKGLLLALNALTFFWGYKFLNNKYHK